MLEKEYGNENNIVFWILGIDGTFEQEPLTAYRNMYAMFACKIQSHIGCIFIVTETNNKYYNWFLHELISKQTTKKY